ncbi:ATP-dependent helicase HrpB [Paenibacillus rhizovicinus]|uniref:ATP-dependent helicase HrpB n=1 Tax=Paenibacillus rhizovicinus TaxID=2704463 RepID=A0A6C0NUW6_9BACL|nr:ATP-dependent helicase HrpB [Paenibacillus rhizovicinus]QHW29975.1 ATP-dependent helicase HrpB [Paenibacillus rhizovicinus]
MNVNDHAKPGSDGGGPGAGSRIEARLPIDDLLPELRKTMGERTAAVLVAAPGAGKTTRVPLALLNEPWLAGQRILMLEPRRLAARSAARFMAASLGEQVGGTVGYRVRMDTKVGPATRVEVITEGVLTRMLQQDPSLEGVGLVIFDEFHERHLNGDLGLALCLQAQSVFREELRLLVMSATLEAEPVAGLLGGAPLLVSEGRAYPVETFYSPKPVTGRLEDAVVRCVIEALRSHEGDALVFLPGAGEIRRAEQLLRAARSGSGGTAAGGVLPADFAVLPLYGALPPEAQDRAVSAAAGGERKIVLATSIAESSVTVRGVRIVVDGGLSRVPRFSPRTGMARLETVSVSVASADQRRGRAGREAPGFCYRLWTEGEHRQLKPQSDPELLGADLAPLALELAIWGIADPGELAWLTPPPAAAYAQAVELLRELNALDDEGRPTPHGQAMAELGMHPRLAHMVLEAKPLGLGALACELAALLGDRDVLRGSRSIDMRLRLDALHGRRAAEGTADAAAVQRLAAEAREWMRAAGLSPQAGASARGAASQPPAQLRRDAACGLLLALAYPDRIAQRRGDGRYLLRNGRGAAVQELQPLSAAPYLAAAELEDSGTDSRILLAAPLALEELETYFAGQIRTETEVKWERQAEAVRSRRRSRLGAIVLKEAQLHDPDPALVADALLGGIAEQGLDLLPWSKQARQLRDRMNLMHAHNPEWPDVSDEALIASLPKWLGPYIGGMRSRGDLSRLSMIAVMEALLSWPERQLLEAEVPTHLTVPSGSRIPLDYSDPAAPVLAVRLQELFGLRETPRIAGGKLPVTIHMLSPAQRPVQVTQDLASFWQHAYFDVKKDLKGRYPKHYWPDNPLEALATNRAKPRPQP